MASKATQKKSRSPSRKRASKAPSSSMGARPALVYALALATVLALGAGAIRLIHSTAPTLSGFQTSATDKDAASDAAAMSDQNIAPPETISMMQTQGWIVPAALELFDPKKEPASELPMEIAAVPEILSDIKPMQVPEQPVAAYQPSLPPPDATNLFAPGESGIGRSQLSLPPLRQRSQQLDLNGNPLALTPSEQAVIVDGDPNLPQRETATDTLGSVIDSLGQTAKPEQPTTQTAEAQVNPRAAVSKEPTTLAQAQAECAGRGFVSRIACQDRVRTRFCQGRWNKMAGCQRENTNDSNF